MLPDVSSRVREIKELPAMPAVAHAIMRLKSDPLADAKALSKIVALDPALAAQVVRFATSAFFGYRGKIDSIQDAVSRVLGFDRAMHIAVGLAAGKALRHSRGGPLGIERYWRHTIYTATLMQSLVALMPVERRPSVGMVYLAGLMHDIGHLLLGHLLEAEFDTINRALEQSPEQSVLALEVDVIGVTHCDLGVWLLRKWRMPPEILAAVAHHHNSEFQGEGAVMAQLVVLADSLLATLGMSDAESAELPEKTLHILGIDRVAAQAIRDQVVSTESGIDALVQQVLRAA